MGCGTILLLVIGLGVAEFALLIELGQHIGTMQTLGLVLLTGVIGLMAARDQGLASLQRVRTLQLQGQGPTHADVLEGPLVALAAVMLLLPGFITDTLGALLLIGPVRRLVARAITRRMGPPGGGGRGRVVIMHGPPPPGPFDTPLDPPPGEAPGEAPGEVPRPPHRPEP
jgi:UPF0716 family protein affecting phage T7 exclusion